MALIPLPGKRFSFAAGLTYQYEVLYYKLMALWTLRVRKFLTFETCYTIDFEILLTVKIFNILKLNITGAYLTTNI